MTIKQRNALLEARGIDSTDVQIQKYFVDACMTIQK